MQGDRTIPHCDRTKTSITRDKDGIVNTKSIRNVTGAPSISDLQQRVTTSAQSELAFIRNSMSGEACDKDTKNDGNIIERIDKYIVK